MNKRLTLTSISFLFVILLALALCAAERPNSVKITDDPILIKKLPSEAQMAALKSLGEDVKVDWDKENATPMFLRGNLSTIKNSSSAEAAAVQFLSLNSVLFKLKNPTLELKLFVQEGDELGYIHLKYDQQVNGIPLWGSQMVVHINPKGEIYCVSGNYHPTIEISTSPNLSEAAAQQTAENDLSKKEARAVDSRATLVVFPWNEKYYLCWNVEVFGVQPNDIYWQYFVDATTNEIVFKYNDVHYDGPVVGSGLSQDGFLYPINTYLENGHYRMVDATSKPMYTPPIGNRTGVIVTRSALNDTLGGIFYGPIEFGDDFDNDNVFDDLTAYPAGVDAHRNFGKIYNFFSSKFGRNSWDGLGSSIKSNVHYGQYEVNAFWHGYFREFFFGDGVPSFWGFSYATDVVAHEFTHAVIEKTAGLKYYGQSGALNESIADVFACFVDSLDWTLGEEMVTPAPGYSRNLENPHLGYNPSPYSFGAQPMVMSEYDWFAVLTGDDNGGVHKNSGIPNHAAYLIASQIGRSKTSQIYYRALTHYLGKTSNFVNAYWGIWSSAIDLYGLGSEMAAVEYAFDSVGVAPGANEWNLRFDDGVPEYYYYWTVADRGLAGEFYLPGNSRVEAISYFIVADHVGGNGNFNIKIFEDSLGQPKSAPKFSSKHDSCPAVSRRLGELRPLK